LFRLGLEVPRGRNYRLFAEYTPEVGKSSVVASSTIGTLGPRSPAIPLARDLEDKSIGDTIVSLSAPIDLKAGAESTIAFRVRDARTGEEPGDLAPFLGAPAHAAIIDHKLRGLVHAHALEGGEHAQHGGGSAQLGLQSGDTFVFRAHFEHPGLHKVWVQFARGGEVIAAPFVVDVR